MSRIIGILAVVGILAAAVFASAAALPVDGGTIQAGEDTDVACTDMGVYVPAWGLNTLAGEYEGVEYVWIAPAGDLNSFIAACNGAKIYARVSDGSKNYDGRSHPAGRHGCHGCSGVEAVPSGRTARAAGMAEGRKHHQHQGMA